MSTAPIFIVGANRSGTTLLRLLLNAHSEIAIPDEINYFYGFTGAELSYENWATPALSPSEYASLVDRFLATNKAVVPDLDFTLVREEILDGPHDLRRPYQVLLEQWARLRGKSRWGEKTPGNIYHANILIEMFPDARFIHVVRDPRGGVASMQRVSFFGNDVAFNALNRHKIMTHGRDWLAQAVPVPQRIEVRYEDLVADPQSTLQSICDFIEAPYEPSMLRFHQDADRFMVNEAAASYNQTATQPISTEMIAKWRKQLTDEEIAIIERICRAEMIEFDYPLLRPSLSWRGFLSLAVKRAYWTLQWHRYRYDRHFSVLSPMFSRTRARLWAALRSLRTRFRELARAWR
ncbi:MAG: sulfotransferase family protein [Salinivenus sp.]